MTENVCFSGGAIGADLAWGEAALAAGHELKHLMFEKHKNVGHPNAVVIPREILNLADPILRRVNNEVLHRKFPTADRAVNNLLRRNYYQVCNTEAVYAVTSIDFEKNQVHGGTAWAVEVFKLLRPDSEAVYVFDQSLDRWFWWSTDLGQYVGIERPPVPSGPWAGIGARDLKPNGLVAIGGVFLP